VTAPLAPLLSTGPPIAGGHDKSGGAGKVEDAARQFEALLIAEMLKSAHEDGSGEWLGTGDDQSGSSLSEMAEEQFAQALAAGGGMGLAKMVVTGLAKSRTPEAVKPDENTADPSAAPAR